MNNVVIPGRIVLERLKAVMLWLFMCMLETLCVYIRTSGKKTTELKNITVSFILFCDPLPLGDVAAQPSLQPPQMKVRHTQAYMHYL